MTSGNSDKFTDNTELYKCMKQYTNVSNIQMDNLETAVQSAVNGKNDCVYFIIGSFYTYQTVEKIINQNS